MSNTDESRGRGMFHMEGPGGHEDALRRGDPAASLPTTSAPKETKFRGTDPKGEPSGIEQLG